MPDAMPTYWYSRLVFERALALIYLVAFLVAAHQFVLLLVRSGKKLRLHRRRHW